MTPNSCMTCAHSSKSLDVEPCNSCVPNLSNWEAKGAAPAPVAQALTDEQIDTGRRAPWGFDLDAFTAGVRFAERSHRITGPEDLAVYDAIAALAAPAPVAQEPARPLPYNPTAPMLHAAQRIDPALRLEDIRAIWAAMWSAAPAQVAQPVFKRSRAGRDEVARFFSEHLGRHDFARYITDTLAADFACALAPALHALRTAPAPVLTPAQAHAGELVEALSDIAHGLEHARIWGGMKWEYNPLHPIHYVPLRDKARAVLAKIEATGKP